MKRRNRKKNQKAFLTKDRKSDITNIVQARRPEKCILIVDDDRDIGESLQLAISAETDYRTIWIAESDLVLLTASYLRPALIVLDYRLPFMDGLSLFDHLQEIETTRGVPVILISAFHTLPYDQLQQRGIHVLKKPLNMFALMRTINQLMINEAGAALP
jgi:DNA-binding response OmpR family regulator